MKRIAFLTMDNIEGFFAYDYLFIESAVRTGEYSLFFFGGEYSHRSVLPMPSSGSCGKGHMGGLLASVGRSRTGHRPCYVHRHGYFSHLALHEASLPSGTPGLSFCGVILSIIHRLPSTRCRPVPSMDVRRSGRHESTVGPSVPQSEWQVFPGNYSAAVGPLGKIRLVCVSRPMDGRTRDGVAEPLRLSRT